MKKVFAIILAAFLLFSLAGCRTENEPVETQNIFEQTYFGVPFKAQYVRTDAFTDAGAYPAVRSIFDRQELESYYRAQCFHFDLERREHENDGGSPGFLDVCDSYDDDFFTDNYLIMLVLQESSGSNSHEVLQVCLETVEQKIEIWTERSVPEVGTDDMAQWHIILELQRRTDVKNGENVKVYMDSELIYDGDKIVPPQLASDLSGPPSGKLFLPDGGFALNRAGCCWTSMGEDGTACTVIADQSERPLPQASLTPITVGKEHAQTIYLPGPDSGVAAATNMLGYLVKLDWDVLPASVTCVCWPDSVWKDAAVLEKTVVIDENHAFYAQEGGYIYEFTVAWEDIGLGGYGTCNYYAYIIAGVD